MDTNTRQAYEDWEKQNLKDKALVKELEEISCDDEAINDRFYKELEFGTGGLRGVLGAGTNRMNIYTVSKATKGLAEYLLSKNPKPSVAIAYDSRINSDTFAKRAAAVFASCGIRVYIWKELMPTPSLSFAIRYLGCDGGIVITASHNPAEYNGYKVYGSDGCQITTRAAEDIFEYIKKVEIFSVDEKYTYEDGLKDGRISIIAEDCFDAFIEAASSQSLCESRIDKSIKIVYTPLYGSGLRCVLTCLKKNGFANIELVSEQASPNGHFPTCPYPNPEIKEALELGLKVAREKQAELLIATDPDCDRVGIAVLDKNEYKLLSGNEVGLLLFDYICKRRITLGTMPSNPICVKTIVTTDLAYKIAGEYGVEIIDVLTGFKFIGEQIGELEKRGEEERYIFGFEESYGYLTGTYVRDKDAVSGSLMIAEMFAYYKSKGKSLVEALNDIYKKYGYCLNTLCSYEFKGKTGFEKMQGIMSECRNSKLENLAERKVKAVYDYKKGICLLDDGRSREIKLPKSDVIKYILDGDISVVIRPSGTEPKLKIYISINAKDKEEAESINQKLKAELEKRLKLT